MSRGVTSNAIITVGQLASVPNPPLGTASLFVNGVGQLSEIDSLGNAYGYLQSPALAPQNMNNQPIAGIASLGFNGDVIASGAVACNVSIGDGTQAVNGSDNIAIGAGALAGGGAGSNDGIAIGQACTSTSPGSIALGRNATIAGTTSGAAICMGSFSSASAQNVIALGANSSGTAAMALAFGHAAVNATASSCLIGDTAIVNIRSNNSANTCDLGTTAAPFKTCWLRDAQPASGAKFSMYMPVTLTNSAAETSLLTGTSVGSLAYSAGQSLGSIIRFRVGVALTVAVADTVTLRFKANGATLVTQVLGGAAFAGVADIVLVDFVVQAASLQALCWAAQNSAGSAVMNANPAYNPAILNTFSLTGQWSAASAGDSLVVNYCYVETLYAQ